MSNPKAEAIQRFHKQAFEHIEAFDKALNDYPKIQTFAIVATKDPNVCSFVPKHLARFTSDTVRLGTIDRPKFGEPAYMQLMRKSVTILDDLSPRYQLETDNNMAALADIITSANYKPLFSQFDNSLWIVDDIVTYAKTHKTPWLDQAETLQKQVVTDFTIKIKQTLSIYKDNHAGQPTYQSLNDLDFRMHDRKPCITLNDNPIQSKTVIWNWLENQGLNPDNADNKYAIVDKVNDLALNVLSISNIVETTIANSISTYRSEITDLNTLTLKAKNEASQKGQNT